MPIFKPSTHIFVIAKIIGSLTGMIGLFMLFPFLLSLYFQEGDTLALGISSLICISIGIFVNAFKHIKRRDVFFHKRDSYIAVAISWIVVAFAGTLPYLFHGSITNLTDAFFESMSGFTTTGSSILTDIEAMPKGLLLWRSMTQWIGGIGMIVFSIALLPVMGIGTTQLFSAEMTGPIKDKIHPRIASTAKTLFFIYLILTFAEFICLQFVGMGWFDAICHSLTSVSTGGFSTKNDSALGFSSGIQYVLIIFMFLAGVNFMLYYFAFKNHFRKVVTNDEFNSYVFFVIGIILILTFLLFYTGAEAGIESSFRASAFQAISMITTTGYVSAEYTLWHPSIIFILFLLMFTGACAGSTTGAMKISRIVLLVKNSLIEFKRAIHPRAVLPVKFSGKAVRPEIITHVLAFFFLYILVFVIGSIGFTFWGYNMETSMGLVATSMGNVGPALGDFCAFCNFSTLPPLAKWVLSFLMILGRLEIFTILILFSPSFWKK